MKKILMILDNDFNPDPRVYKEAKYLVEQGNIVTVFCWDKTSEKGLQRKEVQDGIRIIRCPVKSQKGTGVHQIPAYIRFIKRAVKYSHNHKFDFIHCHDIDDAIIGFLAHRKNLPYVFDMHELYEDVGDGKKKKIFRALTKFLISHSSAALYENDLYLEKPYESIKDKLLPLKNYPDSNLVSYKEKTKSDVFRVGYIGAVRGQIPEFTALAKACKDLDDVRVDVFGSAIEEKEIKQLDADYSNFDYHGPFDGTKELTSLYSNIDITFAGYRTESLTKEKALVVKFFESIVTGTPLILTESYTLMASIVNRNGFGLTIDTRNPEEIKKAIVKLKNDKDFYENCSKNELSHANEYSWNEAVKILDKIYAI